MSEKQDYNIMKKNLTIKNCRLDRVESMVIAGMPDVNFCIDGVEGWIEMKSPKEPKRSTSKLFAGNHPLSQDQMNWFLRQKQAGGTGWVLISTDKRWMLIDGCEYGDFINKMTVNELVDICIWYAEKPIRDKELWIGLRKGLRKEYLS